MLALRAKSWTSIGALSPEWKYEGNEAIGTFPGSMEVLAWRVMFMFMMAHCDTHRVRCSSQTTSTGGGVLVCSRACVLVCPIANTI